MEKGIYRKGGGEVYRGNCLKRGGLGQFADVRGGGLTKKIGWCFRGGGGEGDTPMHTMKL